MDKLTPLSVAAGNVGEVLGSVDPVSYGYLSLPPWGQYFEWGLAVFHPDMPPAEAAAQLETREIYLDDLGRLTRDRDTLTFVSNHPRENIGPDWAVYYGRTLTVDRMAILLRNATGHGISRLNMQDTAGNLLKQMVLINK